MENHNKFAIYCKFCDSRLEFSECNYAVHLKTALLDFYVCQYCYAVRKNKILVGIAISNGLRKELRLFLKDNPRATHNQIAEMKKEILHKANLIYLSDKDKYYAQILSIPAKTRITAAL